MTRPTLADRCMERVFKVAEASTCIRRKAGALAVDQYGRVVSEGYNGVPRKWLHCNEITPCTGASDTPGNTDNCYAIHAEQNLILNCVGDAFQITEVYLTDSPCKVCALMLANLPSLVKVMYVRVYADERGVDILKMAGKNPTLWVPSG